MEIVHITTVYDTTNLKLAFDKLAMNLSGELVDIDDSRSRWMYYNVLGLCGCGSTVDSLKYLRDILLAINTPHGTLIREDVDAWNELLLTGDIGAQFVQYHLLEIMGLTEHGGCAPGWLSDLGKLFLHELISEFGVGDVRIPHPLMMVAIEPTIDLSIDDSVIEIVKFKTVDVE